ncbi:MAG: hypothetical protein IKS83_07510 [Victivallales bacterium]|nr:hypothetical protein [Victivallales bacterium]
MIPDVGRELQDDGKPPFPLNHAVKAEKKKQTIRTNRKTPGLSEPVIGRLFRNVKITPYVNFVLQITVVPLLSG